MNGPYQALNGEQRLWCSNLTPLCHSLSGGEQLITFYTKFAARPHHTPASSQKSNWPTTALYENISTIHRLLAYHWHPPPSHLYYATIVPKIYLHPLTKRVFVLQMGFPIDYLIISGVGGLQSLSKNRTPLGDAFLSSLNLDLIGRSSIH
jgi:hypothetical protein